MKAERDVRIFLVEDNPEDVAITRRALERGEIRYHLEVAMDGQEALDILFGKEGRPRNTDSNLPDLILLDLNLPRLDGREVLKALKGDATLKRIPVVVLTTSQRDEDILRSYDLGVNTYIRKPVSFDRFLRVIETLQQYWVTVATLPSHSGVIQ